MKKKILFLLMLMLIPFLKVKADTISNIEILADVKEDGSASIIEKWDVTAYSGTEWYKDFSNLADFEVSNYSVSMDGVPLEKKENWNINDSIEDKSGYYGFINKDNGFELCFGKSDFKNHIFEIKYNVDNLVFNTNDSQVIYWGFISKIKAEAFSVIVKSYYEFPDDLDVWGYGYKGYSYVKDGIIQMSEEKALDNEYVTLLAKFPLNTFKTTHKTDYQTFNQVLTTAKKGSINYEKIRILLAMISICVCIGFFILINMIGNYALGVVSAIFSILPKNKFVVFKSKRRNSDIQNFRDIPCDKDVLKTYFIASQYGMRPKKENLIGALILKWLKDGNVIIEKVENKKLFGKKTKTNIIFESYPLSDGIEYKLYRWMKDASGDGILENNEFKKWASKNYKDLLNWFDLIDEEKLETLREEKKLKTVEAGLVFKRKVNYATEELIEDAIQIKGLKHFLKNFSNIKDKEALEVKLWNEYLIFAQIFGLTKKVIKQFKKLYPEIEELIKDKGYTYSYDSFDFVNNLSRTGLKKAESSNAKESSRESARESARRAASSYSAGGGGFSSGRGGGGSFGGGSSGSSGGR